MVPIQGLNQKVDDLKGELKQRDAENTGSEPFERPSQGEFEKREAW
jgi:hypothetical protein